jgi:hypothetical protein
MDARNKIKMETKAKVKKKWRSFQNHACPLQS